VDEKIFDTIKETGVLIETWRGVSNPGKLTVGRDINYWFQK